MSVDPPILQPANLFLDLSGEDLRRRLFLTQDVEGGELCLRPEYTIPVCLAHIERGGTPADYCYFGPVFRQRVGETGEFLQAGIESLGRTDLDKADADTLAMTLDGIALYPPRPLDLRIGDLGLLEAMFAGLDVPAAAQRRVVRRLAAGRPLALALSPPPQSSARDYSGLLAAIAGQDPTAARAFVEDVMSIAGIAQVGGRSAGEIAERFLDQASRRKVGLSDHARAVLAEYLAIEGPADGAAVRIDRVARRAGIDLDDALARFDRRIALMRARGIAPATLTFSAAFARPLDYYTGLIVEVRDAALPDGRLLAAGGRYDRLLQRLGAAAPMPAVGVSFWPDRLREFAP